VTELDLNLYQLAWNEFRELADDHRQWIQNAAELTALLSGSTHHVIVNLDSKEYLDPEGFGDDLSIDNFSLERDGMLKGLFSYLFYSSGSGGGDIAEFRNSRWLFITKRACHLASSKFIIFQCQYSLFSSAIYSLSYFFIFSLSFRHSSPNCLFSLVAFTKSTRCGLLTETRRMARRNPFTTNPVLNHETFQKSGAGWPLL
jgi:hypothetical protein